MQFSGIEISRSLSRVRLSVTPWTVAHQAPPSMGFSRQEYWSGFPFPSPGDLPDPWIEPRSPALQADTLTSEPILPLHQEEEHDKHPRRGVELSASSKPRETTHVEGFGGVFQRLVALALGCNV